MKRKQESVSLSPRKRMVDAATLVADVDTTSAPQDGARQSQPAETALSSPVGVAIALLKAVTKLAMKHSPGIEAIVVYIARAQNSDYIKNDALGLHSVDFRGMTDRHKMQIAILLSAESSIDVDEEYSRDEQILNEFIKLHPMLSMEATTSRTMQLVASMLEKTHVRIPDLEEVGKAHDDLYLCPAKSDIGERPCVCGQRCLANHMAKIRYGPDTTKGFVCKEYLLPSQLKDYLDGKGLPAIHQKCLLCSRYWLNYVYIMARADSNFKFPASVSMQAFRNKVGALPDSADVCSAAGSMPTHTSIVACRDGYHPHAMLFVDEGFAQKTSQRDSPLSALLFKPVVRFCSTHYRYVSDEDGKTRIVQVGIGVDDHLDGLGFRQPLSREATSGAADQLPRYTTGFDL